MSTPSNQVPAPAAAPAAAPAEGMDPLLLQVKEGIKTAVLKGEFEIPMLPHVATEVLKKANDPKMGFPELEVLVKQDQALAARVIKTANSPFYRGVQEITSLREAMSRMGMKTLKDIIVSLGIQSKAFKVPGFEAIMDRIWDHSVACAGISQMMAKKLGVDPEQAFLAGLLHDIGKPIIVQICSKIEQKAAMDAAAEAKKQFKPFDAKKYQIPNLREKILPQAYDEYHEVIGAAVAKRWNLSELVCEVVRHHHHFEKASDAYKKICTVIHLANMLCHHCGLGHDEVPCDLKSERGFQELNVDPDRIADFAEDAPKVAHSLMGFM